MLHLLQPNIPNRNRFLLQLVVVSALFHVGLGILLLYVQTDQQLYQIIFNNNPIDLVDMIVSPAYAHSATAWQARQDIAVQQQARNAIQRRRTCLSKLESNDIDEKKAVAPLPKKTEAKKPSAANLSRRSLASPSELERSRGVGGKKVVQPTPKKIATKKNIIEQKKPVQSVKKVVTQKEYDALALQQLVQEELQQYWQPPSGLSDDLLCEMAIEVDIHGAIKQLECVRSSGVLMYDIHAQSVLLQVRYPKETWGKQLTIMFKQA